MNVNQHTKTTFEIYLLYKKKKLLAVMAEKNRLQFKTISSVLQNVLHLQGRGKVKLDAHFTP